MHKEWKTEPEHLLKKKKKKHQDNVQRRMEALNFVHRKDGTEIFVNICSHRRKRTKRLLNFSESDCYLTKKWYIYATRKKLEEYSQEIKKYRTTIQFQCKASN